MTATRADARIAADQVHLPGTHGQASQQVQVQVQVSNGHAVLRGDVPSAEVAEQIRARVQALIGVEGVDSRLQVDSGSRSLGEPGHAARDTADGGSPARAGQTVLRPHH